MKLMNVENALDYICKHQFDLDPQMRNAVFSIMEDREKTRRWVIETLIPKLSDSVDKLEIINERLSNRV